MKLIFSSILLLLTLQEITAMPGGLSEAQVPASDDKIIGIVNGLQSEIESELGRSVDALEVIEYKTQVVAGINYFVKVRISPSENIHVRIYKSLNQGTSLTSVQQNPPDDIVYF